jgi:hypothetical protein
MVHFVGALKSGPLCEGTKEWYFVGAIKSGPFCVGNEKWSILWGY